MNPSHLRRQVDARLAFEKRHLEAFGVDFSQDDDKILIKLGGMREVAVHEIEKAWERLLAIHTFTTLFHVASASDDELPRAFYNAVIEPLSEREPVSHPIYWVVDHVKRQVLRDLNRSSHLGRVFAMSLDPKEN